MIKSITFIYNLSLIKILVVILFFTIPSNSQQVIGEFPEIDGGFEGQTVGPLTGIGGVNSVQTNWTTQSSNRAQIFSVSGRSGPSYVRFFTPTSSTRLHSPTTTGFMQTTTYIIQFYYQGDLSGNPFGDIRGRISYDTLSSPVPTGSNVGWDENQNTGSVWKKYAMSITTGSPATLGVGIVDVRDTAEFNIDDFVIYQGSSVDNTAPPDVPNTGTFTVVNDNDIRITWEPPNDVSDVVGYLLLRTIGERTSAETPNINGIYAVGNSIGSGAVVALVQETGTPSYEFTDIGAATSGVPNDNYYYYAWAVDKAFNYSANTVPLPVELASLTASVVGKSVQLNWRTETEVMNYGFEVERAPSVSPPKGENWVQIGFVRGHGNSNSPKEYSFTDKDVKAGKYSYRLKQIDTDGQFEYFGPVEVDLGNPQEFELEQNYPNPFNPFTTISFNLPKDADVKLTVFNILGQEVKTLINESRPAGIHSVEFDASSLNSGFYFYKVETGKFTQVRKMLLVK